MEEQKNLYVGLDLCDDRTQLSCYNEKIYEPESICQYEEGDAGFPTVLGVREATGEWLIGEDAVACEKNGEGILINHIIGTVMNQRSFKVYNVDFTGVQILEKFLRKCLRLLKKYYPDNVICKLTVTIKYMNIHLIKTIYEALRQLGIEKDRVQVVGHEQCYLYYALSQKKELWMNDVGLFEFDEVGLSYHQISINRRTIPMMVSVASKDLKETLSYELLKEQEESVGYIFDNIAKSIFHKQIVSTVYITGVGFEGHWADAVLKELCIGRRLFVGQNLYSRGACYMSKEQAAKESSELTEKLSDFIFLSDEMITCNITTRVYYGAKMTDLVLAKAGMPWYDVDTCIDLIPDFEEELEIVVKDIMKRSATTYLLHMDSFPKRKNKMSRIGVRVQFIDHFTCVVTVKDLGFGEIYPSTNRVWEKTISLIQ